MTEELRLKSVGVLGLEVIECREESLTVVPDGKPVPEHVSVDFSGKTNGQRKTISKRLRDLAVRRGRQFKPMDT